MRVEALSKRYGAIEALTDVSFDVRHGEVFGLLGLNGAGKTPLISILATERRVAGDALLLGHSIRDERRATRQMTGAAPQEIALYPKLMQPRISGFSVAFTTSRESNSKPRRATAPLRRAAKTTATSASRHIPAV